MNHRRSKSAQKSAAELMAELNTDPNFQAQQRQRMEMQGKSVRMYEQAFEPVLRELEASGVLVKSLGELHERRDKYSIAVPILVRWLPYILNAQAKEALVRALSVPWAASEAAPALIAEFKNAEGPQNENLRWTIANGLAVTATDDVFEQLAVLVADKKYGKAREMLTLALGNCHDGRAINLLIELLGDEQVVGHAVMALGQKRAKGALESIRNLLSHPKPWVRAEATKALARIAGGPASLY